MTTATATTFDTIGIVKFDSYSRWTFTFRDVLLTEYGMITGRDYRIEKIASKRDGRVSVIYYVPLNLEAEKKMLTARWEWIKNDRHALLTLAEMTEELTTGLYFKYVTQ